MAKDFGSSEDCVNDEEIFYVLVWVADVEVRKVVGAEAIVVQIRCQLASMIENHT